MGTDPGSIIIKIVTLFALIFVNAFFSMSEMAIVTLNDNKIDKMASEGNKKAKQIQKLTENTSSFLSTIQIGVTLAGFLTSATAAQSFAEMLTDHLALAHCEVITKFYQENPEKAVEHIMLTKYGFRESEIPLAKLWHFNQE